MSESETGIRLAHFSDIHVAAKPRKWPWRDYFNKRLTGWINKTFLGRGQRFANALIVLDALMDDLQSYQPQHCIFSGDASMMGYPEEMIRATQKLFGNSIPSFSGIAVPGNHDHYVIESVRTQAFEKHFTPWQQGIRVDNAIYPFAQKLSVYWLIGVNSSRPNRIAWDARGEVGPEQRQRLEKLLQSLPSGPRILVTHYPLLLQSRKPESYWRRLRDWKEMRDLATKYQISLWLHGHRHSPYFLNPDTDLSFPTIGAGSATQNNRWGYNQYQLLGNQIQVQRRVFDPVMKGFENADSFVVQLPYITACSE